MNNMYGQMIVKNATNVAKQEEITMIGYRTVKNAANVARPEYFSTIG